MTEPKPNPTTSTKNLKETALPIKPIKTPTKPHPIKFTNKKLYAVFNALPDGQTIKDIPARERDLYTEPILTEFSYENAKERSDIINAERATENHRNQPYLLQTPTEVLACDITYSKWRVVTPDS